MRSKRRLIGRNCFCHEFSECADGTGGAKQWPFWIRSEPCAFNVSFQILIEIMIRRHVVPLATFLMQPNPSAAPLD